MNVFTSSRRAPLGRALFALGFAVMLLSGSMPALAQKGRAPVSKPAVECDLPGGCPAPEQNSTPSKDAVPNVGCNAINFTETLDTTAPATNPDYTAVTNTQTGRLLRNATASSCAAPKTNPGLNDTVPGRQFDAYTFTPAQSSCVTFTMTQPSTTLFFYAVSSYNPAAPDQNYLADAGSSSPTSSFSMNVTAGQPFTIVVNEVAVGGGLGTAYSINITGLCTAGGPTNVDSQVTFTTTTQGLTGIAGACAGLGYTNQYNINVDLRNIGTNTFTNPFFQVIELQQTDGTPTANPFRLRTADDFNAAACTGGLVGTTQAIPGPITPAQVIPVNFQIAMPQLRRFRFLVSVFATSTGNVTRNGKTVKLGELAITGLDRGGKPVVSATFTPEKGQPSLAVANVTATPAK